MTTAIAETLDESMHALMLVVDAAFSRWPVVRYGARRHIPSEAQRLIFARDNYRCRLCGADEDWCPLAIDHIVPWSAGGSDRTDNLRVLCRSCNGYRSNLKETYLPRQVPCVSICIPCWMAENPGTYEPTDERVQAWCGECELTSWVDHERYLW